MPNSAFTTRLRVATRGSTTAPLSFLGNFEVEEQWAATETTLPRVGSAVGAAIVNRMDEFALWLGGRGDVVFLKDEPDPHYLDDIVAAGFDLPTVYAVIAGCASNSVTGDIAQDKTSRSRLAHLAVNGYSVLPHSVSVHEANLAAEVGIEIAAPDAATCKAVNSKVYSRWLADRHGIRQPEGATSESLDDWTDAITAGYRLLENGSGVVLKEAYGVSGKGIVQVDSPSRLSRLDRLVRSRATANGGRAAFCVERWLPKASDLNYQFTVSRDGSHHFDFVKFAVTENGVHRGHMFPAPLSGHHLAELHAATEAIAGQLFADGYFGVVGVDALIDTANILYPIIEINARLNMSTYQAAIDERVAETGLRARAKHYDLRLNSPVAYEQMRDVLGNLRVRSQVSRGLLINNYGTVNAAFASSDRSGRPTHGRLYGVLLAENDEELDDLDGHITSRLSQIEIE